MAGTEVTEDYTTDNIRNPKYPVNIWLRVSQFLGERGTQQSVGVREIIDNAVHESIRGFATRVKVTFHADKGVSVQDDGRGLPTDISKESGKNGIIMTMATMNSGANFTSKIAAGKAGAGLNGVGGSVTNALSKRFDAIVYKGGKKHVLSFQDGYAGQFTGEGPDASFAAGEEIVVERDSRSAAEKKDFKTGTLIRLWYNPIRFPATEEIDRADMIDRLRYTAYTVPGLIIDVTDENQINEDGTPFEWHFHSDHGLPEMIEVGATDPVLPNTDTPTDLFTQKGIYTISTQGNYNELAPDADGHTSEVTRTVTAELAFRYGTGYEKNLTSFVNTIHTHLGGVHERALEKAMVKAFGERMATVRGLLTAKDEPPIVDDYFEGMTVALSVNVPEPQFVGQQKDKLSGPEVEKALTKALTEALVEFVNNTANQKFLKPMFEKIKTASQNRRAASEAKAAKRKSTQVSSASMPEKLADCDLTSTEESELLICEGDSAAGTVIKARDATYQAVIPIRGKILNSHKATIASIMKNTEVMDIAKALGAGFGKDFDIDKIRYGKVLFAADADDDGLQICNLLFTVFNRLFHQMVVEGRVYQTVPPLFEVKVKGKGNEVIYVKDDAELSSVVKTLDKAKKTYTIERNKGLGEMDPQSFHDTVLDPDKRTLRRITVEDVEKAEAALSLMMGGSESEARKVFMSDNFQTAIDSGLVDGFEEGID